MLNLSARVEQLALAQAGRGLTIPRLERDPSSGRGQAGTGVSSSERSQHEDYHARDGHHARVQAPDLKPMFPAQADQAWGWPAQDAGKEFREWQAQSTNGLSFSIRPDGPTVSMLKSKLAKLKLAEVPPTWLKWAGNCRSVLRFLKSIPC